MVDYSKWDNIEISDDEDDTHPNVDNQSLFKWRHEARLERMADMDRDRKELKQRKDLYQLRLADIRSRIESNKGGEIDAALKQELRNVEKEGLEIEHAEEELAKKEEKQPLNVDTISKPGFQKTIINKKKETPEQILTEAQRDERMRKYIDEKDELCKHYSTLTKYEDSKNFLLQNLELVCEETVKYLTVWCITLEMEEKHHAMANAAHQCMCMQHILEAGKSMKVDPRGYVNIFFTKIVDCDPAYRLKFESEINEFKQRICKRAEEKVREALLEANLPEFTTSELD